MKRLHGHGKRLNKTLGDTDSDFRINNLVYYYNPNSQFHQLENDWHVRVIIFHSFAEDIGQKSLRSKAKRGFLNYEDKKFRQGQIFFVLVVSLFNYQLMFCLCLRRELWLLYIFDQKLFSFATQEELKLVSSWWKGRSCRPGYVRQWNKQAEFFLKKYFSTAISY